MFSREEPVDRREYEERLRFEALLTHLSTRFINLPADQVDGGIEEAQRQVCAFLNLELSTLWQISADHPGSLVLSHAHRPSDFPSLPATMDAKSYSPWALDKVRRGESVVLSRNSDAPAAAAVDVQFWNHYGLKSSLLLPLSAGGGAMLGALSFNSLQEERAWPPELIKRLELVAQIFANALARKVAEQQLRESEERLSLAAEAAAAGLWALNAAHTRFWINAKLAELFGLPPCDELDIDRFFNLIYADDRSRIRDALTTALGTPEMTAVEYRIVRPDGSIRWMQSRGQPSAGSTGTSARLMGLTADITERKETEELLRRSSAQLHRLAARLAAARDDEQKRIASGLHDDVAQLLAAASLKLQTARAKNEPRAVAERLDDVARLLGLADESIRTLTFELGSATLYTLGMQKALEELCDIMARRFEIRFVCKGRLNKDVLDDAKGIVLYKATRELMFNVAKHAGVQEASISLGQEEGRVIIVVEDRGRGTDLSLRQNTTSMGGGLGLFSIGERMAGIGGGITFESTPAVGTRVTLWVHVADALGDVRRFL